MMREMLAVIMWSAGLLCSTVCAESLLVPNGTMELPAAVGAWSTTKPAGWNWSGTTIGLTDTGGADGSRQTLYGNQLAGTLTSAVLPQTAPGTGILSLRYWVKRANTGPFGVTSRLYVGGSIAASRTDVISTNAWTQYTVSYAPVATDSGKALQVEYAFANGSGAWQGYLDEVTLDYSGQTVGFAGAGAVQQETSSVCTVYATLASASTNTVQVNYLLSGGTATQGVDVVFAPGVLTFTPGVTSNSFSFTVLDNSTYEGRKTVVLALSNAVNSALGGATKFTVTVIDPEDRPAPRTFYVDADGGSDADSGTNSAAAWSSFTNVNAHTFVSGDSLLLKAGCVWTQQLYPKGSGDINGLVTIGTYGTGNKPVINAGGITGGAVYLLNQEYWSINNLEVSNQGATGLPKKQGILIKNDCVGTLNSIYVRNCYIHDVNGVMDGYVDGKESGGIVFYVTSSNTNVPSKWNDVRIENNTIMNVAREGILLQSLWVNKPQDPSTYWSSCGAYYPSTEVIIASNVLQGIGGDGIVPWAVNGARVEYNYVADCNSNSLGQGHAAIWPYISENIVFQYNEVCRTRTVYDGMAFDFDNSAQNCIYQYNYSHDNEGGFLNMCCDGNGNGNIARYNISQNDGCAAGGRVFLVHGDGNHNYQIYNNTVYVKNGNPEVFHQGAASSGSSIYFYNNIIVNEGSGPMAAPGGCVFDNNLFYGNGAIASDAHKILLAPDWVSAGSGGSGLGSVDGYRLRVNSPALGAGRVIANNGGLDYWGNAVSASAKPSLGAYNGAALAGSIWFGAGSGSWTVGSNWDGGTVPGPGDEALMGWGRTARVGAAAPKVGGIFFVATGDGSTVEVNPGGSLEVLGNIYEQNPGEANVLKVQGGALTVDGVLSVNNLLLTGGTLRVDGVLAAADGEVRVAGGATLAGTGTVARGIRVAGNAVLTAGNPAITNRVGTLTATAGATLEAGAVYAVRIGPAGCDLLAAAGGLILAAGAELAVSLAPALGRLPMGYTATVATGAVTGRFKQQVINLPDQPPLKVSYAGNTIKLIVPCGTRVSLH